MNKVICTTTINPPTEAIQRFSAMEGWLMVVAGDKKTPESTRSVDERDNCHYLSPVMQEMLYPELSNVIGWNCIQRRNFAFLFACKELKADIVASCDDDNIPYSDWGKDLGVGKTVKCDEWYPLGPAFDPLSATLRANLWHRGFPLELVKEKQKFWKDPSKVRIKCDIQANLWNGDPDVDAICRLSMNTSDCLFGTGGTPFTSKKPSPFNSQNTFLSREVMPHYFMFPGIGRMDDIAGAYHVQAQGFRVMYGGPTVVQKRNEHNIIEDLKNELWGIENNLAIVKDVPTNKNAVLDRLPPRALEAFRLYQKHFE